MASFQMRVNYNKIYDYIRYGTPQIPTKFHKKLGCKCQARITTQFPSKITKLDHK